ncbi:DUF1963 domain-containing protein [Streptomonospora nanhaiensis]|uniref:DUF1963 domain-containing protein n=2 Tax=Streptomonospora nanhaiensis TaxID=1323731 RepID=A0ABY6YWJ2_9ACTN|nr:DUF1963 domain-containing protein [Streptomonospora nanhaiensis]WAE76770.1 DUF1963 domain-containing protein [Streptomonospora nanhaiensis]
MSGMDSPEQYRQAAREAGVPEHAIDLALGLARPQIELTSSAEDGGVLAGRYGGLPSLPPDAAWGSYPHLVASVDCAALPRDALDIPLPEDGHLLFFANKHDPLDDDEPADGDYVVYVPVGTVTEERSPQPLREDLGEIEDEEGAAYWATPQTDPRPLYARTVLSLPTDGDDALQDPELRRVYRQYGLEHHDKRKQVWAVDLLLGGYAYSPQDPPVMQSPEERAKEEWVLLAQAQYPMQADPDCTGCPFWIIRRSDLEKRDFAGAGVVMWEYH